jgi:undecaprenyl-diphosphatase
METIHDALVAWDRSTFLYLNHAMKSRVLDLLMPALTDFGLGQIQAIAIILTAVYLEIRTGKVAWQRGFRSIPAAIRTHRSWTGPLLVAVAMSGICATAIKRVVPGERPYWFYLHEHRAGRELNVEVYTVPGTDPLRVRRFPSGHVTTSVAMATVVTILYRRRRQAFWGAMILWIMAFIVAMSRIYLASHWPLDVIAGTVLGIVTGYLSVELCRAWAQKYRPEAPDPRPGEDSTETPVQSEPALFEANASLSFA